MATPRGEGPIGGVPAQRKIAGKESAKAESDIRKLLQGLGGDVADEAMSRKLKEQAFNRGEGK
jgi:hypothetical protein